MNHSYTRMIRYKCVAPQCSLEIQLTIHSQTALPFDDAQRYLTLLGAWQRRNPRCPQCEEAAQNAASAQPESP